MSPVTVHYHGRSPSWSAATPPAPIAALMSLDPALYILRRTGHAWPKSLMLCTQPLRSPRPHWAHEALYLARLCTCRKLWSVLVISPWLLRPNSFPCLPLWRSHFVTVFLFPCPDSILVDKNNIQPIPDQTLCFCPRPATCLRPPILNSALPIGPGASLILLASLLLSTIKSSFPSSHLPSLQKPMPKSPFPQTSLIFA